jgi:hypothetical protein
MQYFRGHTGSLALRPGDSLTILEDGFVNRLQDLQFPALLLFKLRGLDSCPGGTLTHWLMPAFTGRTHCSTNPIINESLEIFAR